MFKATLRGEHTVAVKTMRVAKITEQELSKFKAELIIMAPLHHHNLVRLYGGVWNEGADKLCIVLEFCRHGSLKSYMGNISSTTWAGTGKGLALGTAKGLRYLHRDVERPLVHRDIKPDNILVGAGVVAKLADFGLSKHFDRLEAQSRDLDSLTMTPVGTGVYLAPEVRRGGRCNESVASAASKPHARVGRGERSNHAALPCTRAADSAAVLRTTTTMLLRHNIVARHCRTPTRSPSSYSALLLATLTTCGALISTTNKTRFGGRRVGDQSSPSRSATLSKQS